LVDAVALQACASAPESIEQHDKRPPQPELVLLPELLHPIIAKQAARSAKAIGLLNVI
jgi:hypothetical protein